MAWNRISANYKSSINYLATFRNNRDYNKQETKDKNENGIVATIRKSNYTNKRSMSSNNSKTNMINPYNRNNPHISNIESKSLRDIIMNNNNEKVIIIILMIMILRKMEMILSIIIIIYI